VKRSEKIELLLKKALRKKCEVKEVYRDMKGLKPGDEICFVIKKNKKLVVESGKVICCEFRRDGTKGLCVVNHLRETFKLYYDVSNSGKTYLCGEPGTSFRPCREIKPGTYFIPVVFSNAIVREKSTEKRDLNGTCYININITDNSGNYSENDLFFIDANGTESKMFGDANSGVSEMDDAAKEEKEDMEDMKTQMAEKKYMEFVIKNFIEVYGADKYMGLESAKKNSNVKLLVGNSGFDLSKPQLAKG